MKLHERLKDLRLRRKLTQEQVAAAWGVTRSNVSHVEKGAVSVDFDKLNAFAQLVGMTVSGVLKGVDEPPAAAA